MGEEHNGGRGGMKSVSKLKSEHNGIFQVVRGRQNHLQLRGKTCQGQSLYWQQCMFMNCAETIFCAPCSSSCCAICVFRCLLSPSMALHLVVHRRHHSYGQKLRPGSGAPALAMLPHPGRYAGPPASSLSVGVCSAISICGAWGGQT